MIRLTFSPSLLIIFILTVITLLTPPINALPDESLIPFSYRWFVEFTVQFTPPLHDVMAFAEVVRELPTALGKECFFHPHKFIYEPVISETEKYAYRLYTVIPSGLTGPMSSNSPNLSEIDHALDVFDGSCSADHISSVVRKLNMKHSTLQIAHLTTDLDLYNTACVFQERNPNYQGDLNQMMSNDDDQDTSQSTSNTTDDNNVESSLPHSSSSSSTLKRQLSNLQSKAPVIVPASDGPNGINNINNNNSIQQHNLLDANFEAPFIDHYFHGANCPRAAELMQCESNLDCNHEAGSYCKLHFNRRLKKNLNYCSLLYRWKDPFWEKMIILTLVIISFIYLAYALQSCEFISCLKSLVSSVKDGVGGTGHGNGNGHNNHTNSPISTKQQEKIDRIHHNIAKIHQDQAYVIENPQDSVHQPDSSLANTVGYAFMGAVATVQRVYSICIEGLLISFEALLPHNADLSYKNTIPHTQGGYDDAKSKKSSDDKGGYGYTNGPSFSSLIQNEQINSNNFDVNSTNSNFARDPSQKYNNNNSSMCKPSNNLGSNASALTQDCYSGDGFASSEGIIAKNDDVMDEVTLVIPDSHSYTQYHSHNQDL